MMELDASSSMNWEIHSLPERSWADLSPMKEAWVAPGACAREEVVKG